jgi:hypothetical protein
MANVSYRDVFMRFYNESINGKRIRSALKILI